jgi:virginiamycin B lyase
MQRAPVLSVTALAVVLAAPGPAAAQQLQQIQIDEWQVPWEESRPRDPFVGPDGKVWFVGQRTSYAAYLDPETGDFKKYDLDDGTGPHNLIVDHDGIVWYAGNRVNHIGRLDPASGEIKKYWMPDEAARDPHTLVFNRDGNVWFTVQQGNFVGRFDKTSGDVQLVAAPEVAGGRSSSSRPYGIKMDSQNRPWIALFNTNKIATVDPETMELESYDLPEGARPRRLEIDSHDIVWYVDYRRGYLGRLDPETGDVREWANPSGENARPYGMAIDDDGRIWFVETGVQPNKFVGFDVAAERYFSNTEVGSGGGTIRHMFFHAPTNTVWFGADTNTIGRATLPPRRRGIS